MINHIFPIFLLLEVSFEIFSLGLKIILYTNLDVFFVEILFEHFDHVTIKYFTDFMLAI